MSNILRRPMFRGGPVSSYGTGIASGLGYEDGGRVGYEEGGSTSKDDVKQKVIEQVSLNSFTLLAAMLVLSKIYDVIDELFTTI